MDDALEEAMEEAAASPLLVGDAGKVAERIYIKFNDIFLEYVDDAGNISAKDALTARRELDAWIKDSSKGKSIFTDNSSASGVAVRKLRQSINKLVNDAAPSAQVSEQLAKMNRLLDASEVIAPKAFGEVGSNVLGRTISRLEEATGLRAPVSPMAAASNVRSPAAVALTGLGALTTMGARKIANTAKRAGSGLVTNPAMAAYWGTEAGKRAILIDALKAKEKEQE